ncbi:uncharacterized protein K460DRAFT_375410 [Cucurbitaria berberidis CBS 394.84]|uniref:F-box domain-containing protein n=1 Tax=Cucurbitaria berberidis CBS 394.84 TaxID=1168544 RepID=A0A9P4GLJ1_9PLEO|nr:uncharacterized protein K460DRAFT_375410 [Cucurbitaria berberidis CBS 394.84]KAF1848563.1 hypothetical protein K460DRAFT_375410 [Cucurbitaria berberidis CBS 394.84]
MEPISSSNDSLTQALPALPTELWLQILECTNIHDAAHLWSMVRHVSRQFKDYVERLFIATYLPKFAISLALPRRDPTTGTLRWSGTPIPGTQIVMSYDHINLDHCHVLFRSPVLLEDRSESKSVQELKDTFVLPKERLEAAVPWVYFGNNPLTGSSMMVPANIHWDDKEKTWVWEVNWIKLISQFYMAKHKSKFKTGTLPEKKKRVFGSGSWR